MFDRKLVVRAVVVAVAAAAIAACSSAPVESSSSTGEALGGACRPPCHWESNAGEGRTGGSLRQCVCDEPGSGSGSGAGSGAAVIPSILSVTGVPRGAGDQCGTADAVGLPPVLAGLGCTTGMIIDGQPVWACPSSVQVSPWDPIGILSPTPIGGACFDSEGTSIMRCARPCEATRVVTSLTSNCLGSPNAGWVLVIDAIFDPQCITGGCAGTCAIPRPPVAQ